jgi:hypothetical protein
MNEVFTSPCRKYLVQTLAVWGACCVVLMMLLDSGRGAAIYAVASGLFWLAAWSASLLRPTPSHAEVVLYRIGPIIAFAAAIIV